MNQKEAFKFHSTSEPIKKDPYAVDKSEIMFDKDMQPYLLFVTRHKNKKREMHVVDAR